MRILKNRAFHHWAKDIGLEDSKLEKAIEEIEAGSVEANLGGNIYKKRVSIGNKGKSGGARTIVAFKLNDKAFFIYGFAKSARNNITNQEKDALKELAKVYFNYNDKQINQAIKIGEFFEVKP